MPNVTRVLKSIRNGDPNAARDLLPLVYDELRHLAAARLANELPGQTLQATALVHEAYLRLVGNANADSVNNHWDHRGHFFAAASEAMRRILVEHARRKKREKHGGTRCRVALDSVQPVAVSTRLDLVALDAALTKLAATDNQAAKLVELRYFGGLPLAEAARVLSISPRTADRVWAFARAWLHRELIRTLPDPEP